MAVLNISTKIKAASLLEATIAIVIISTVFSIGMLVVSNTTSQLQSVQLTKAHFLLHEVMSQSVPPGQAEEENFQQGNFIIEKKWKPYTKELMQLTVKVSDQQGKLVLQKNELFSIY